MNAASPPLLWRDRCSGSTAPVVIVLLALIVSTAVFFVFTRRKLEKEPAVGVESTSPAAETGSPAPGAAGAGFPALPGSDASMTTGAGAEKESPTPAEALPERYGFARPIDLGQALLEKVKSGEWASSGALAVAGTPDASASDAAAVLKTLVTDLGFKPGAADEVVVLGQTGAVLRLALPFEDATGKPLRLPLDLERDEKMGWKITQFRLPAEMAAALKTAPPGSDAAGAPTPATGMAGDAVSGQSLVGGGDAGMAAAGSEGATRGSGGPGSPTPAPGMAAQGSLFVVEETVDALTYANDFVGSLIRQDFQQARAYIDESRVPAERLAALCIVFEEGSYRMVPSKPLVMTVANEDVSWVIAQVESTELGQKTEFGLELERAGSEQPWRVVGLNLSDILGSFAQSAGKLGVPYTPIVKNPRGGESLALYFEYDEAGLHPRAEKQLDIVANLLKSDDRRKLRIAGHTDALGTDDYNIRLSQERAETVKLELVARGVAADQIETAGLGKEQPLGPNLKTDGTDDPEGRSKNRRAEIYLDF